MTKEKTMHSNEGVICKNKACDHNIDGEYCELDVIELNFEGECLSADYDLEENIDISDAYMTET